MAKPFRNSFFFFTTSLLVIIYIYRTLVVIMKPASPEEYFYTDPLEMYGCHLDYSYDRRRENWITTVKDIIPTDVKFNCDVWSNHFRSLELKLERPCYVEIGGKLVYYDKVIKAVNDDHDGEFFNRTLSQVSGILVRNKLFSWVPVTRIGRLHSQNSDVKFYYQKELSHDDGVSVKVEEQELPLKHPEGIPVCKKPAMDWLWVFHV